MPEQTYRRFTVDTCEADAEFLARYLREVEQLAGLTEEFFGAPRALVLPTYFRATILEKAKTVLAMHRRLAPRLHVDNPGVPLQQD